MDEVLERLKEGVRRFQAEVYPERAEMFVQAANERQQPHTLFITCADSRVDPNLITNSDIGEVFVTRNIGNMVPAYGDMLGGVSAVVDFAVVGLEVRHIVICGHTHCGAMQALLSPNNVAGMPAVASWLENANAALVVAKALNEQRNKDEMKPDLLHQLTEQNVLLQIQHLKSHPSVVVALAQSRLTISGWIYNIGTGQVAIVEDGQQAFEPVGFEVATGA